MRDAHAPSRLNNERAPRANTIVYNHCRDNFVDMYKAQQLQAQYIFTELLAGY